MDGIQGPTCTPAVLFFLHARHARRGAVLASYGVIGKINLDVGCVMPWRVDGEKAKI